MCILQLSYLCDKHTLSWLIVLEGLALGHLFPSAWAEHHSGEDVVEERSSPGRGERGMPKLD